jgi:hypothetical protein
VLAKADMELWTITVISGRMPRRRKPSTSSGWVMVGWVVMGDFSAAL